MSAHPDLTWREVADRLEIRELIDAYAHHADGREPEKQYGLYAEHGRTLVQLGDAQTAPDQILTTREEHLAGFGALSQYEATTHFNGQSTIVVDGDGATGETYCLAHHLAGSGADRELIVMSIRYEDVFRRTAAGWRFAERKLVIRWTDTRPSHP
ncbi:MAG: nuclear transport factor 2 family protein [Propionibacteriaceae bacterium]|jgi:hypothetical protein|nr:nuclear transport factor 2 family protein [Propionibacteriaceae bacterium]